MTDLPVRPDLLDPASVGPFSEDEAGYARASGASSILRGYRSDWREFTRWCDQQGDLPSLPAYAAAVSGYLAALAGAGVKVGTMSRRLSAIRFVHQLRDQPDPTRNAHVVAVWEGIRRTHGALPEQSAPLMPPDLFDVVDACPTTKVWRTPKRPSEPDLAGARDRALLLVGFVAALRRSELAALTVDQVAEHPNGLVLTLPRSKTNQTGERAEVVVLPRPGNPERCPVIAIERWRDLARSLGGATAPAGRQERHRREPAAQPGLHQHARAARGRPPASTPANTARTTSGPASSPTPTFAGPAAGPSPTKTRHRALATLRGYVRVQQAWTDNAATSLGL